MNGIHEVTGSIPVRSITPSLSLGCSGPFARRAAPPRTANGGSLPERRGGVEETLTVRSLGNEFQVAGVTEIRCV
jgi:hypothetical protein